MLNLLLLLPLLQDRPVETSIEAYLNGDAAARIELLKRGPRVIPALLGVRDKKPEAIDALHAQFRQAAAYPATVPWGREFGGSMGLSLNLERSTSLDSMVGIFHRRVITMCSDSFVGARLKTTKVEIKNSFSPQEFVDMLCGQTGLDYGYFHNFLVIGLPERLWACREPAKVPDLDASARAKASEWIGKLGDESVETRDAATRELVKLGRAVIPLLEGQGRLCDAIIIQLRSAAEGAFGPSACLRQKLTGKDEELLKRLHVTKPQLTCDKTSLADVAALLLEHDVECVMGEAHRDLKVTLITSGQTILDVLSVITQVRDLDFLIRDRKVIIDTREAIEKKLQEAK